jgi:hypothetical protein
MSEDTLIAIIAIVCAVGLPMLIGMVAVVMGSWEKVRIAEQQTILKRELLDRGFNAEEIIRVIESGAHETADKSGKPSKCH